MHKITVQTEVVFKTSDGESFLVRKDAEAHIKRCVAQNLVDILRPKLIQIFGSPKPHPVTGDEGSHYDADLLAEHFASVIIENQASIAQVLEDLP